MNLGLSSLRSAVKRKFSAARLAGDLTFSDTKLTILKTRQGVPFQLRYCPALAKKPIDNIAPPKDESKASKPKFDPFANPSSELLVANVPPPSPSHALVLNKFPVIPNHFILATKEDKPQTDLLDPGDLAMTYACLEAWPEDETDSGSADDELFAFFNSGPHSGASQPHRHLQFLPIPDMKTGLTDPDAASWRPLIESLSTPHAISEPYQLAHNPTFPFTALSTALRPGLTPAELYDRYITLLRAASLLTAETSHVPSLQDLTSARITDPEDSKHVSFSYNLALTRDRMAICARRAEGFSIPGLPDSHVALNCTVLAGTMMVKECAEWDALRSAPEALDGLLAEIGYPPWREDGVRL
ncbi:uncharacterized protein HMPREF1541_08157 [Cyphellophora europaea CBS 101466]|uniref:Uncharacterized protein n=1 Tax=Cyphellophora europaea (strain CBS 101466) TaxID=1220924 RepID=W2RKZ2_CYPE1|nr:uncharacterized protein HMPREF1541_08157 [Cyphellophora europaea CBS 101466]ETN37167.1 hypothetical protein HMPREF1541_08157 [Cyphellophora europaea CBS 101466]